MESCMNWEQVLTILIPMFALFAFLYKELKEWRQETRDETQQIRQEIGGIRQEIQEQVKRSDRLYEMFIDLLKSQNPKTNP